MDNKKIPVTIITGFLGSGKTTLLNNIIQKHKDKKFAIIENEYGDIGIDSDLIINNDETIFELNNGCICCSLQDGFQNTISSLLNSSHNFNHLLIETTGIANPDSIISTFIATEEIQKQFIIDSVICVVDAVNIEDFINEQAEVRRQLALADITLINKSESVHQDYLNTIQKLIGDLNPMTHTRSVSYSNIDDINMLDNYYFTSQAIERKTINFSLANGFRLDKLMNQHDISTEGFILTENIDMEKFETWLKGFLFFNSHSIFRAKGILSAPNSNQKLIFQSIKTSYQLGYGKDWGQEKRFCKLIFIGKYIDRDMIESSLKQLIVKA